MDINLTLKLPMKWNGTGKYVFFIIFILFLGEDCFSYNLPSNTIGGKVSDIKTKENVAFAIIHAQEINSGTMSDDDGYFTLNTSYIGSLHLKISSVGYQTLDTIITLPLKQNLNLLLRPANYSLKEVIVTSKEGTTGNSTSLIEKTAMQHVQPSSFADLLELLPGHSSKEINLSGANYISMRQAGSDENTSLGTSFIVDGTSINNDANLQSFYGLNEEMIQNRITTSKGVDMRTISTDKIESVEVIRGIPSVKYGDVTAGVVKIELKSGHTPWEGRAKVDLKNKLFSVGKGVVLPKKKGVLNFDLDYALYSPDTRSNLVNYSRVTGAIRYENKYRLNETSNILFKGSVSYTGSFDDVKDDAAALGKEGHLKTYYNNIVSSLKAVLRTDKPLIKEISLQTSLNYTKDKLDRYKLISGGGTTPLTTIATEEGIYDTHYLPTEYYSNLVIDGKPIIFNGDLDFKSELKSKNVFHSFSYGFSFNYNKNKGKGAIFDKELPPYLASSSARARAFNDVPAMQKLSFYLVDNINWKLGKSNLQMQPGVRLTTLPGIDSEYKMSSKIYAEPRINMKFTFPRFNIGKYNSSFSLTGGAGILYKFPTLSQLYPDKIYSDYVQLNYYSLNEDYRFANVKTYVTDPTNYNIEPAKNLKFEIGFVLIAGQIKADVTFFREIMDNGFSTGNNPVFHEYTYYNAEYIQNPTSKPNIEDFKDYTQEKVASLYQRNLNDAGVYKTGIEYTISLGKIPAIYTSISLNGAWFRTHYTHNEQRYYKPNVLINNRPYPYVAVYDYNNNAKRRSQFNTNISFDTHIPFLRMIFTTSVQNMWFETTQRDYNSSMPIAYIDNAGTWHEFTTDLANQTIFKHIVDSHNEYYFLKDNTAMMTRVNLKLSKEIGDNIRLACYFNNLLTYMPDYTNYMGTQIRNRNKSEQPYFGAELNIKF